MAKVRDKAPSSEASGEFLGSRFSFGKLLLVYCMRLPDLESLGIMKPLGP